MRIKNTVSSIFLSVFSLAFSPVFSPASPAGPRGAGSYAEEARRILGAAGTGGGFVVHLGSGDGRLTAALRADEKYIVQGLERNAKAVEKARAYVMSLGLYGPVSIERLSGSVLPYVDDLVNLVVVDRISDIDRAEIFRVLAPEGAALFREGNGWKKVVKPRPETIDVWTHYLHDSGNNAVAFDKKVAPPRTYQWIAPPWWLRSHETPSGIEGLVCSGPRIFYFFDEGIIGITDQRLPERWSLVCRDAFNGKLLWKRPVSPWGWPAWARSKFEGKDWRTVRGGRTAVPVENHRRIVAAGERVYAVLSYDGPMVVLDAATGREIRTIGETAPVKQILRCDGKVIVYSVDSRAADRARRRGAKGVSGRLRVFDERSLERIWAKVIAPIQGLFLGAKNGRIVFKSGSKIRCLRLSDGGELWSVPALKGPARTMIVAPQTVVCYVGNSLRALDAGTGRILWRRRKIPVSSGSESPDLFLVDGIVWRGMIPVDEKGNPTRKSAHAMALGFDVRTGKEVRRIVVRNLRSPEHHHRCYRNKSTCRYIISAMEGAEFLDLTDGSHCQNNWYRGACRLGIVPANGMLYVPADQCFCEPGSKLLGFLALRDRRREGPRLAEAERLERGEVYTEGTGRGEKAGAEDWPTFRHDPARHGATAAEVGEKLELLWRTDLPARSTQVLCVRNTVYAAARDAHTVYALDASNGHVKWRFTAGGRIDSPPTFYRGLLLFGCADGRVYCLRASDGKLRWRFLGAVRDLRIGCFDQLESLWPIHGSVLVTGGTAYFTAGRSTYMDGGIRVWGVDPETGAVKYKTVLKGPFPKVPEKRDYAFYLLGANSDVLVAEGGHIYMRQKKLTPDLKEVKAPVLSSKGAQDVGLHVFSTAGLLDDSWYNRTFWMYSKRWPGFQLAQQAPKSGQLLVVDETTTYAVKVYYLRNVHSCMFFPGRDGYILYADKNTTEPQIVGEPGAKKPVEWLPQSYIPRPGKWDLESPAFGRDKMIGYTRAEPPVWKKFLPIRIRAMVKAGRLLFIAGPPDVLDPRDPYAAFEGRKGAVLAVVDPETGDVIRRYPLPVPPVFDGMSAARGKLFISLEDGSIACFGQAERSSRF